MFSETDKDFFKSTVAGMIDEKLTERIKPRPKWENWAMSWFKIATPMTVIGAIWWFASFAAKSEVLQFDTAKQKEFVVNYVENAPNPILIDLLKRHTTDPGIHMSKEDKDSIYVTRTEYLEFYKNFAVDQYNMKRSIDKVLELMELQQRDVKALDYKLDRLENNN